MAALDGSWFKTKTWNFSFYWDKNLLSKLLSWQQPLGCHFVSFVMHICGARFQEHCLNSFKVTVYFSILPFFSCKSYDVITDLICILQKCQYLWNEERYFQKEKPFFCISKGLSKKQKIFFTSYTLSQKHGEILWKEPIPESKFLPSFSSTKIKIWKENWKTKTIKNRETYLYS